MGRSSKGIGPMGVLLLYSLLALANCAIIPSTMRMEANVVNLLNTYDVDKFGDAVYFLQTYATPPAVFMITNTFGSHAASIRIKGVGPTSFRSSLVEPMGWDGPHIAQTVPYIAADYGVHQLGDGTVVEVGFVDTTKQQFGSCVSGTRAWEQISFKADFQTPPIVLAFVQTINNEIGSPPSMISKPFLTVAVSDITTAGVKLALERSEAADGSVTINERIAYLAMSRTSSGSLPDASGEQVAFETIATSRVIRGWGSCSRVAYSRSYSAPVAVPSLSERIDSDGGWLRYCESSVKNSLDLVVDEDGGCDTERSHSPTSASVVVFDRPFAYLYCKLGHYCVPNGDGQPVPCPAGTYGDSGSLVASSCSGPCLPGHYCPIGSVSGNDPSRLCKAGRYGSSGSATEDCTGPCTAGYICPAGSASPVQQACGGVDKYCPAGSSTPRLATAGFYTTGPSETTRTSQETCPRGSYCTGGRRLPCPAGTYGATTGLSTSSCSGKCEAGYFCPEGSVSATQEPCGIGANPATNFCPAGTSSRRTVSANRYSTPANGPAAHRTGEAPCTVNGFVCIDGQLTSALEFSSCPTGTATRAAPERSTGADVGAPVVAAAKTASGSADTVTYGIESVNPGSRSDFTVDSSTGQVKTAKELDFQTYASHEVIVTATASSGTLRCAVTVLVGDVNEAPTIAAGQTRAVEEMSPANTPIGAPLFGSDPDVGQSLSWTLLDHTALFKIEQCSGILRVVNPFIRRSAATSYTVRVRVADDASPSLSFEQTITVSILDRPEPPVLESGSLTVDENLPVGAFVGQVNATDPDAGDTLTFTLVRASEVFALDSATGRLTVRSAVLNYEQQREYALKVQVADQTGRTDTGDVVIRLRDVNDPPVTLPATLYIDENVAVGTVAGVVSATDEDAGSTVTFSLTDPAGKFAVSDVAGTKTGRVTLASGSLDFETKATYPVTVTATDNAGATATATVTIELRDVNDAPQFSGLSFSVFENATSGSVLVGALGATDEDAGQVVRYSIAEHGPGASGRFAVAELGGAIRLLQPLDFETQTSFWLRVKATDTAAVPLSAAAFVNVTVLNVNEPPVLTVPTWSVTEDAANGTLVGTLSAVDPEGDAITFSAVPDSRSSELPAFAIAADGKLTTFGDIDYEQARSESVQVRVSDAAGASATGALIVSVTNVDEAPVFIPDAQADVRGSVVLSHVSVPVSYARTTAEASTTGTRVGQQMYAMDPEGAAVTYALSGTGAGSFRLSPTPSAGSAQLEVSNGGARLTVGTHAVTVTATDATGHSATAAVTVTVTDSNFPPEVAATLSRAVAENSAVGTTVGAALSTDVTDQDSGDTHTYAVVAGNDDGVFAIASATGQLTVARAALDFETKASYTLLVSVTDSGSPRLSATTQVTVSVTDVPEAPTVEPTARVVDENTAVGSVVGAAVVATDPDAGSSVTLTMRAVGAQAGWPAAFALSGSGVLTVAGPLDFESGRTAYDFNVTATDNTGLTATARLSVLVRNVNEAPSATGASVSVAENAGAGKPLAAVTASDPDADTTLAYSIVSGNGDGTLAIDARTGVVSLAPGRALDFEDVVAYSLVVNVTDNGIPLRRGAAEWLWTTATVSIAVTDVNDVSVTAVEGAVAHGTGGGEWVYVNGSNFGPTARKAPGATPALVVTYAASNQLSRYTAADCRIEAQNTRIACRTVAGVGAALRWRVSVDGAAADSPASVTTSYAAPTLTGVDGAGELPTNASTTTVTFTGTNFGPVGTYVRATYTADVGTGTRLALACDATVTVANTAATCRPAMGAGTGLAWTVTVAGQASAALSTGAYGAPRLSGASAIGVVDGALLTRGGQTVRVVGDNLGDDAARVTVTYGPGTGTEYAATGVRLAVAHRAVEAVTVPGVGTGLKVVVTVGGQASVVLSTGLGYQAPRVAGVEVVGASTLVTEGGQTVRLTGAEFGPVTPTLPLAGQRPTVRYGVWPGAEFTATGCRVTVAHTEALCVSVPGTGANHSWSLEVGAQRSAPLHAGTAYQAPIVTLYAGDGAVDGATAGGQLVRVSGRGFGTVARNAVQRVTYQERAKAAGSGAPTFVASNCNVTKDHEEITCMTTAGAGADMAWTVVVDGQTSVAATTEYGPPAVTSISGAGSADASTAGGQPVTLTGANFGPPTAAAPGNFRFLEEVTYGPSGAEYRAKNCSVVSHTRIECVTAPGVGSGLRWTVVVQGQRSVPSSATSSYAAPTITSMTPNPTPTTGGDVVVRGTHFGVEDVQAAATVVLDGVPVAPTLVRRSTRAGAPAGEEEAVFRLAPGEGSRSVVMRVGMVSGGGVPRSSGASVLRFAAPVLRGVTTEEDTVSTMLVTLVGTNFGTAGRVLINGAEQPVRGEWSQTAVTVVFEGESGTVQLETGGQTSNSESFVYYSPAVSGISLARGGAGEGSREFRTAGGAEVVIRGKYFGSLQTNVTVGGRACASLTVNITDRATNEGTITCVVPEGDGTNANIVVFRGVQDSAEQKASYIPPTVASTAPAPLVIPTVGASVSLAGDNFGVAPKVYLRRVAGDGSFTSVDCSVTARSHTSLTVAVPAWQGTGHSLTVEAGNQFAARPTVLAFQPPTLVGVSPASGATDGGYLLTLTGANFGVADASVSVGGFACAVQTQDHERVTCRLAEGQGSALPVRVTVQGQTTAQSVVFSFLPPAVASIAPREGRTAGGALVVVTGSNFGLRGSGSVQLVSRGAQSGGAGRRLAASAQDVATVTVPASAVVVWSHSRIEVALPPGQGADRFVRVAVAGQESPDPGAAASFTYAPPVVAAVSPGHGPTAGGTVINITGDNFGVDGAAVVFRTPVGDRPCTIVPPQTHTWITCATPAAIGSGVDVIVSIGARAAGAVRFSYDPPRVDYILPNEAEATGDELKLRGVNFGSIADNRLFSPSVLVDGVACAGAELLVERAYPDPYIRCKMAGTPAGWKNVTVTVAGQTTAVPASREVFRALCPRGYYGQEGEVCLACPAGGDCPGEFAEPTSVAGWYNIPVANPSPVCPVERRERRECVNIVPCSPTEACLRNNTCAPEYASVRCTDCAENHYRIDGECEKCPDNPWLLIGGFFAATVALGCVGYVLNQKAVNLAVVSIGVDYAQVLSMFSRSKIAWPPTLKRLMLYMSVFNFNIELTAPECAVPDVGYTTKWFMTQALPIGVAVLFLCIHVVIVVRKRCIQRRTKNLDRHVGALIGTASTAAYYLYLLLTRTSLEVFNCSPTDPPDGRQYMQAVFVPCYEAGSLQMQLLPFAIVTIVLYTIGYPSYVSYVLYRNRAAIRVDQYLRAKGLGDTRLDSSAYDIRKRFSKLYYHFKPPYFYFILVIIARKFLIAVTALMFRANPAFQLSVALLVMFVSYILQVRIRPFMSTSQLDRVRVVRDLEDRASKERMLEAKGMLQGQAVYSTIEEHLKSLEDSLKGTKARRRFKADLDEEEKLVVQREQASNRASSLFFDYNNVESILLACGILVCLGGVCLESGRFASGYYSGERDFITYILIAVIAFSLVYYSVALATEIIGTVAPHILARCFTCCTSSSLKDVDETEDAGPGDRQSRELELNPMFTAKTGTAVTKHFEELAGRGDSGFDAAKLSPAQMRDLHRRYLELTIANADLETKASQLRAQASGSKAKRFGGTGRAARFLAKARPVRSRAAAAGKRDFGQQRADGSLLADDSRTTSGFGALHPGASDTAPDKPQV